MLSSGAIVERGTEGLERGWRSRHSQVRLRINYDSTVSNGGVRLVALLDR